jgi:hypothetical protein
VMACVNACIIKDNKPLESLSKWFEKNANDFESSICLLDMALKYGL